MLFIIQFFKTYLKSFVVSVWGLFTFYLINKNSTLLKQNKNLNKDVIQQSKNIQVKKEIINVIQKTKPTNISGNIERMRNKEL
jgi:hypothetical protein